jgi:hypothetical protein
VSGHRYLFAQLVRRELRRKYKGSSLGVLWYLINPLVLLGAYTLMFGHVFRLQHFADYPIFLMAGLMAWTFFAQSLLAAAESLIDQGGIVRRARFPRETIPAAAVTVQLATFAAILVILVPLSLALRGSREPASVLLLPLLVVLLFGFALGCALIVSVLHAYYRDVAPILAAVRADHAHTLKGLLLGRRAAGPAAVPALQRVTLSIAPGETVGMVGRNGAGKTSTLRVLAGIVPLHAGEAGCGGRVVSLLELAAGFSRDFSGRENIYLQGALYGLGKGDIEARLQRIIAFSELGEFIDIPGAQHRGDLRRGVGPSGVGAPANRR